MTLSPEWLAIKVTKTLRMIEDDVSTLTSSERDIVLQAALAYAYMVSNPTILATQIPTDIKNMIVCALTQHPLAFTRVIRNMRYDYLSLETHGSSVYAFVAKAFPILMEAGYREVSARIRKGLQGNVIPLRLASVHQDETFWGMFLEEYDKIVKLYNLNLFGN